MGETCIGSYAVVQAISSKDLNCLISFLVASGSEPMEEQASLLPMLRACGWPERTSPCQSSPPSVL